MAHACTVSEFAETYLPWVVHCTGFIQSIASTLQSFPAGCRAQTCFLLFLPAEVLLLHCWGVTGSWGVLQQAMLRGISMLVLDEASDGLQMLYLFRLEAV